MIFVNKAVLFSSGCFHSVCTGCKGFSPALCLHCAKRLYRVVFSTLIIIITITIIILYYLFVECEMFKLFGFYLTSGMYDGRCLLLLPARRR